MMKTVIYLLLFAAALVPASAFAQKDTVYVPDTYLDSNPEGTLNDSVDAVIQADSVNHTDKLSNTVFKLIPDGYYVLTGVITTPPGETLDIEGPTPGTTTATALPMIIWTSSSVTTNYNFDCYGPIILKNIWLMYANTQGTQVGSELEIEDNAAEDAAGIGEHGTFDDVIFDYCPATVNAAGAITVVAKHFVGDFKNCYFKNDIDSHLRYYGRAVSFPYNTVGYKIDSCSFTNCTFANLGYVYMQEGNEYSDYVSFNHCTFLNIMMFPLESSWWHRLAVTNCIFVNPWMFGEWPAEDSSGGGSGTFGIDSVKNFGFTPVPAFTDQQRHILFANSSYYYQPWLVNYMATGPYSVTEHQNRADDMIPQPDTMLNAYTMHFFTGVDSNGNKLFPLMNEANLYDGVGPRFVAPPTNIDSIEQFLYNHWSADANCNWAYEPDSDFAQIWPLRENLSYANDTLAKAGINGFPLGDLYHWWNGAYGTPDYYSQWKGIEVEQDSTISRALRTGILSGISAVEQRPGETVPSTYTLSQNYPNPFNPTTQIEYSVPKRGLVTLQVYNVLGEKVATLFSGVLQPGSYSATFDGSKLASGVYFYRLKAGSVSITKKLVLLK